MEKEGGATQVTQSSLPPGQLARACQTGNDVIAGPFRHTLLARSTYHNIIVGTSYNC